MKRHVQRRIGAGRLLKTVALIAAAAVAITVAAATPTAPGSSAASARPAAYEPARSTAAPRCPGFEEGITDLDGLSGDARPVVLIHGWMGNPMQDSRKALERMDRKDGQSNRAGWQYLLFDYSTDSNRWASQPVIAACLASYIKEVSDTHRNRGGNGLVYLVGHSMGGTAIRFALDPTYGGVKDLGNRVAGVITIDTPHQGAGWGNSVGAAFRDSIKRLSVFPDPSSDAWKCLAGDSGDSTWHGCDVPPYLPGGFPVHQVAGEITAERHLFGVKAYDVPLSGDGIVPTRSQHGYIGSAPGRPPKGKVGSSTVSCRLPLLDGPFSVGALLFGSDSFAIDALYDSKNESDPRVLLATAEPVALAIATSPCSHTGIPKYQAAMRIVSKQLDAMAALEAAEQPDEVADCGKALAAAVAEQFPGFGELAVDRCEDGWAYLGSAEGMGDTEMVWRFVAGSWQWFTGMPTNLCPADVVADGGPDWVVELFAYRDYACG